MAGSSSALVWVTRRAAGDDDGAPFRAARADDEVELRAVDADHVGAGIVVTARDVLGEATVPREAITAVACAAVDAERWELVVVAGARRAIGHGTPASVAALARELARELGVPYVGHGVTLLPPVPHGWSLTRPGDQLTVTRDPPGAGFAMAAPVVAVAVGGALVLTPAFAALGTAIAVGVALLVGQRLDAVPALRRHQSQFFVLEPGGLHVPTGPRRGRVPLDRVERFVARTRRSRAEATLVARCDDRDRELVTSHDPGGRATRAVATRLNLELDRLRAAGDRRGR
ncbi:MAG: hypothetical protein JNK64_04255 [Myxococcales bacterium]|nr:hypothetical protein [Myxococcales bacterium]